jgi:hypothetical protein
MYSNKQKINKLYEYDINVIQTIPNIEIIVESFIETPFTSSEIFELMFALYNNIGSVCFSYDQTIYHNKPVFMSDYFKQKYDQLNDAKYLSVINACESVGILYQKNIMIDNAINLSKSFNIDESVIMQGKYKDYSFDQDSDTEDEEYTYGEFLESLNY